MTLQHTHHKQVLLYGIMAPVGEYWRGEKIAPMRRVVLHHDNGIFWTDVATVDGKQAVSGIGIPQTARHNFDTAEQGLTAFAIAYTGVALHHLDEIVTNHIRPGNLNIVRQRLNPEQEKRLSPLCRRFLFDTYTIDGVTGLYYGSRFANIENNSIRLDENFKSVLDAEDLAIYGMLCMTLVDEKKSAEYFTDLHFSYI